jgi:peroxiredoxin
MARSKADRLLLAALAVLFIGFVFVIRDLFEQRIVDVGDTAPEFSVTTESGRRISTREFGGRLLVVNFWATWCPPCVEEMPSLSRFAQELNPSGVVVLGVSVDKSEAAYRKFLEEQQLPFHVTRDPEAEIPAEYGTFKWPETYIINRDGKVVQKYIGPRNWTEAGIVNEVKALL